MPLFTLPDIKAMTFEYLVAYLLLGAFAGTIAGLFGVGGGLIIVPMLATIFTQQGISGDVIMHLAIGTSLATIIPTSISSVLAHHRAGAVLWPVFLHLVPGILIGAFVGAYIADQVSPEDGRWHFRDYRCRQDDSRLQA